MTGVTIGGKGTPTVVLHTMYSMAPHWKISLQIFGVSMHSCTTCGKLQRCQMSVANDQRGFGPFALLVARSAVTLAAAIDCMTMEGNIDLQPMGSTGLSGVC